MTEPTLSEQIEAVRKLAENPRTPVSSEVVVLRAVLASLEAMRGHTELIRHFDNLPQPNAALRQLLLGDIADAICEAGASWMSEPLHRMAYEDMARAAFSKIHPAAPPRPGEDK